MTERMIAVRGAELCVETFGRPGDPAIVLLAGIGSSMDGWDPAFCARLAAGDASGGRLVVRYDQRDTGRSTAWPAGRPGYSATDLTEDAAAVVDAVSGGRAHVVGISAGPGFVAGLKEVGVSLFLWGIFATLAPMVASLYLARYVFKFHPAILLGVIAGARTTTAALGMIQDAAKSKVPALGYGAPYAVGNTLLTISGLIIVLLLH